MERWQLQQLQNLPLEIKIRKTQQRIQEWYEAWNGNIHVSFSGGKDSTVLLHIARGLYPDIQAVFADTGLEYPEIRSFVKGTEHVTWLKPKYSFKEVINKYGYPVISKEVADAVHQYRLDLISGKESQRAKMLKGTALDKQGRISLYDKSKWLFLVDAPFKIDAKCCYHMKKAPFHRFERMTGSKCMIATMAVESRLRETAWLKHGCNAFEAKEPKSTPMSFWKEEDVLQYIRIFEVPYAPIYGDIVEKELPRGRGCRLVTTGLERSGCMFCMFGVHLEKEPNRFQRMKLTHPAIYEYCMRDVERGGLGLSKVLDYIGVNY